TMRGPSVVARKWCWRRVEAAKRSRRTTSTSASSACFSPLARTGSAARFRVDYPSSDATCQGAKVACHLPSCQLVTNGAGMFRNFRYLLWGSARLLLPLRYHWTVHGRETLRDIKAPVLVLPNHPAYIDPMLVYTVLYRQLKMRPMVFTGNFNNPIFWLVRKILDAHDSPD